MCSKFDDSSFTYLTDMKIDPKYKNMGDLGWLESPKFIVR